MNDRFRFRAWNKKEKIMYYDAEQTYDFLFGRPKAIPCDNFEGLLWDEDFVVEQCTGLKDKNGKLIYEGDIISRNGMFRKVFWLDDEGGFGYEPGTLFEPLQTKTCKIVGNIHENPEFLEQSK